MAAMSMTRSNLLGSAFLAAAMTLPSLQFASAETPPERSVVSFKYLNYQDSQSGDTPVTAAMSRDRIAVNALSVMGVAPIAGQWSIGVTLTDDSVSGASPAYHSSGFPVKPAHDTESGASGEIRHSVDLQLTRYFSKGTLTAGSSYSTESDYISRSCSLQGTLSTEDKNTTVSLGGSFEDDSVKLNAPNVILSKQQGADEKKQVVAGLFGITRVLTKEDIVQLDLGYSNGNGYYTDPYKDPDKRPRDRNSTTVLARWNHHFNETDGTARLSYRYYTDTFGIRAHTFGAEYVQPLPHGWTLTPLIRFYSQTAADFYFAVADEKSTSTGAPLPPVDAPWYTEDHRLSAFGAVTAGLKVSKQLNSDWLVDAKFERYEQRDEWCLSGKGDPGLATFKARSIQVGVSRQF